MNVFSVSCVSCRPQPSSSICGGPSGTSSPIGVGNEQEFRRRADPDAAEADLQPADQVQPLHEHGPLVELAVAVGVLEDQDPVFALPFRRRRG